MDEDTLITDLMYLRADLLGAAERSHAIGDPGRAALLQAAANLVGFAAENSRQDVPLGAPQGATVH